MKSFKAVTFNLRCVWEEGINSFPARLPGIIRKINALSPDVICFQEATERNIAALRESLPGYNIVFNQRDADFGGEGLAAAVKKDKAELLSLDFFWLSKTPVKPGSRYLIQSGCPRICQCLLIKLKEDGSLLRIYNNHLDHKSESARKNGITLVLERVNTDRKKYDLPFFILGDFNATPDSETVKLCRENKLPRLAELTANIDTTFHDFGKMDPEIKIDYIFSDEKTAALPFKTEKWAEQTGGVWLSDHYPVQVSFGG